MKEKKSKKGLIIVLVAIVAVVYLVAMSGGDSTKQGLEVVETSSEFDEYGVLYITGTVKNDSSKTYSYVQVTFNLYDDSGSQVGSTMTNTNNLEGGGTWKFRAGVLEDDAATFKLMGIEAF